MTKVILPIKTVPVGAWLLCTNDLPLWWGGSVSWFQGQFIFQ